MTANNLAARTRKGFAIVDLKRVQSTDLGPDGRYLIYTSRHASEYAVDHTSLRLRVMTSNGKRTVTVCKGLPYDSDCIMWLP